MPSSEHNLDPNHWEQFNVRSSEVSKHMQNTWSNIVICCSTFQKNVFKFRMFMFPVEMSWKFMGRNVVIHQSLPVCLTYSSAMHKEIIINWMFVNHNKYFPQEKHPLYVASLKIAHHHYTAKAQLLPIITWHNYFSLTE